ncbi:hypothetical protein L7F22_061086 [Adiantum nelumboides]|nr:hypothetical protein [Adiantum nelumboides]
MLRASECSRGLLRHVPPQAPLLQRAPKEALYGRNKLRILALQSPKGFGPPSPKSTKAEQQKELSKTKKGQQRLSDDSEQAGGDDDEVPEIVMDRMIKRIGVSIAVPVTLSVLMFPLFWYLKVKLRLDVPDWLPLLVSGVFFGSAALGITYGIVSTSWDPLRDGSFLGWKEAKANWPMFFNNLQGKQNRR